MTDPGAAYHATQDAVYRTGRAYRALGDEANAASDEEKAQKLRAGLS
jgi:hypothetical protein